MPGRRMTFPLARIGILLVVGAVAVSFFEFYVGFGALAADLSGNEEIPETRTELKDFFINRFLFTSSLSTIIFWLGLALVAAGAARRITRIGRR
jgi:hypothetical protein